MTRLTRFRLGYVTLLAVLAGASVAVIALADFRLLAFVLVVIVLLIPGRIQGYLWRDFFRGTRLLRLGRHAEAIPYLESFRGRVSQRPLLKRAIWLAWPGYTADVEVMTLTNLGAAHLGVGALDAAEDNLEQATRLDPQSALAWVNLAVVRASRRDSAGAEHAAAEARRLGYRGNALDRVQQALSGMLTRVEGRGIPASNSPS
jgi:tetratricopeptide (TPR) repeat protein